MIGAGVWLKEKYLPVEKTAGTLVGLEDDRIKMEFPEGRRFAFSILDDTDDATVNNIKPIYDLLADLGVKTTKTVWPLDCPEGSDWYFAAQTLQDTEYLEFIRGLYAGGFELAWHSATMESSERARTVRALKFFENEFGFLPTIHCNHGQNRENIYWGANRYQTRLIRSAAWLFHKLTKSPQFSGEVPESTYFWGDLCRRHFRFVRNFTFSEINVLKRDPWMPYRLSGTPFIQYWFSTADAPSVHDFNGLLTVQSIDRLVREAGVCIVSTHFGKGFARAGKVNDQTADALKYLASQPGWFVPVSRILDFLLESNPLAGRTLSLSKQWRLECRHILDRCLLRLKSWNP